jgi:uncharacterized protein
MSRFHDVVRLHASLVVAMLLLGVSVPAGAQGGQGRGMMGGGMMNDPAHQADMQQFHFLLDNGPRINRVVTVRPDGVESVTESDDPTIAKTIQEHVSSMSARVKEARPIHQRDPLFQEVFRNADKIVMQYERTPKGVKVVETSTDPYVAKLIQAHAEVVTAFIANGRAEAMKNHAVPERGK